MPLKLLLPSLDDVPEPLRACYRPRADGEGFILDVEGGVVAKGVHDEFRSTNIQLKRQLEAFGDLSPAQAQELRDQLDLARGDLEKSRRNREADAEARFRAVQEGWQKKLEAAEKLAADSRARLETVLIDGEVGRIALEAGAHAGAIEDIAARVRPRFRLGEDHQPRAVDASGNPLYSEDGQPLGIVGAVRQLVKSAPHLFKSSSGGGATNASAGGGRATAAANPWAKDSWNATEQMKLVRADRAEATRLAAEAGHSL